MEIITELVRRAALVLLLVRVFLLTTASEITSQKVHTAPRSPARPWALEARTVRKVGRRVVAVRLQLIAVAV